MSDRSRCVLALLAVVLLQAPLVVAVCYDAGAACTMEPATHDSGCEPAPTSVSCCGDHQQERQVTRTVTAPTSPRFAQLGSESWPSAEHLASLEPTSERHAGQVDCSRASPPLFTLFSALLI